MMTRRTTLRACTVTGILCVLGVGRGFAEGPSAHSPPTSREIRLLEGVDAPAIRLLEVGRPFERSQRRVWMELNSPRTQAESWLHDAGLSLLEDRDPEGKRRYHVMSGVLTDNWPTLRLRARVGRPELSAGLQVRREVPALGFTVPWQQYTVELEGLGGHGLSSAFTGSLRWSDPQGRLQYGVAFPVTVRDGPAIGVVLQIGIRLGR